MRRRPGEFAILFVALLLLAGCRSLPLPDPAAPSAAPLDISWLAGIHRWPGAAEQRIQVASFEDRRSGQVQTVRYDVQLTEQRITMVAQSTLGVPLYQSVFERGEIHTDLYSTRLRDVPVEPAVADFVLANWPPADLQTALARVGYTLDAGERFRSLRDRDGRIRIEMNWLPEADGQQTMKIVHYDIPMTVLIQTVDRQLLP